MIERESSLWSTRFRREPPHASHTNGRACQPVLKSLSSFRYTAEGQQNLNHRRAEQPQPEGDSAPVPTLPVRSPERYRHGRNWKEPQLQYQYCPLAAHLASYARSRGRDPGVRLRLTPLRLHYPGSSYPALSIRSYYPLTTDVYLQLPIVRSSWLRDAEQLPTRAPRVLASPQLAAHRPALKASAGPVAI